MHVLAEISMLISAIVNKELCKGKTCASYFRFYIYIYMSERDYIYKLYKYLYIIYREIYIYICFLNAIRLSFMLTPQSMADVTDPPSTELQFAPRRKAAEPLLPSPRQG